MRTTINIDDSLYRRVKIKAAQENRTVKDLVETALRRLLAPPSASTPVGTTKKMPLPLIPAGPGEPSLFSGMSNEDIHQHLADLQQAADMDDASSRY